MARWKGSSNGDTQETSRPIGAGATANEPTWLGTAGRVESHTDAGNLAAGVIFDAPGPPRPDRGMDGPPRVILGRAWREDKLSRRTGIGETVGSAKRARPRRPIVRGESDRG